MRGRIQRHCCQRTVIHFREIRSLLPVVERVAVCVPDEAPRQLEGVAIDVLLIKSGRRRIIHPNGRHVCLQSRKLPFVMAVSKESCDARP